MVAVGGQSLFSTCNSIKLLRLDSIQSPIARNPVSATCQGEEGKTQGLTMALTCSSSAVWQVDEIHNGCLCHLS